MAAIITVLIIQLLTTNFRSIVTQQYNPDVVGPAADDFPDIYFSVLNPLDTFGCLFVKPVSEIELTMVFETGIYLRLGDAFLFNSVRYLINLEEFLKKQAGTYQLPPLLTLHPSPLGGLGKACQIPNVSSDILNDFVHGLLREEQLLPGNPSFNGFELCTPPGFIPLLSCNGPRNNDGTVTNGVCTCSVETFESRWTSYVYQPVLGLEGTVDNETVLSCAGSVGSICNGATVQCATGLLCERDVESGPAFCGGSLGVLARGFGGNVRYTDEQLTEILRKRKFKETKELEGYLIRVSNSFDVIGKDCNPKYFSWATKSLRRVIGLIGPTAVKEDVLKPDNISERQDFLLQHNSDLFEYFFASVLKQADQLDRETTLYNTTLLELEQKRAEYYDVGESCVNEFPRMTCRQKISDPVRGLCECATSLDTGSEIFNYFAEGDQCVGGIGAVCTTMRGSGDHICAQGLVCESLNPALDLNANERIPGPLAHHEIKVCKRTIPSKEEEENKEPPKKKNYAAGSGHRQLTFLPLLAYLWRNELY